MAESRGSLSVCLDTVTRPEEALSSSKATSCLVGVKIRCACGPARCCAYRAVTLAIPWEFTHKTRKIAVGSVNGSQDDFTSSSVITSASFVVATVLGLAAPVSAQSSVAESPKQISVHDCAMTRAAAGVETSGRYVEASSEADAIEKLDALDCPKQQAATYGVSLGGRVNYGPCTLHPSYIHLRKSGNHQVAGAKPYTKCTRRVTSIQHATDTRYKWYAWWEKAGGTDRGGNRGEVSYMQRSITKTCKGDTMTTFMGTTVGTIVDRGHTYYARVYTSVSHLKCTM